MQTTEGVMHKVFGVPFLFMKRPEWDKFPGAVHTFAADTIMPDGKILQQPSTHLLGQNFSKPFEIKFKNQKEEDEFGWQTCYGPAISRIFASVVALHGDDKGLVFPWEIAPLQIIVVPIFKEGDEKVLKKARELACCLAENYSTEVDLSKNTPGWKFNQWEMKGVPIRIEIGSKEVENKTLTLALRHSGKKIQVKESEIIETLGKLGKEITKEIVEKSDKFFKENIRQAKDMEGLEK